MKKLLFLLLALPVLVGFTACDDDDDFPPVDITINIEGATQANGKLYVVQGDNIDISSITMTDNTSKGAVIGAASYFWDYYRVGGTIVNPYSMTISTAGMPIGTHLLQIEVSIYAVDYSPCVGLYSTDVVVVPSVADIPSDGSAVQNPSAKATVTEK